MCNKFLQTYACGHNKSICTTPCAHALRTAQPSAHLGAGHNNTFSHSNSTVFTLTPREDTITNFSRPQTSTHSPLRVANPSSTPTSPTHIPAFRFVAPESTLATSPVSPVSPSFTQHSHPSAPPSRFPSPAPSTVEPESKFCAYYIPRYLVPSKYPCNECYGKNEWEDLRGRWMENYRLGHPLEDGEEVKRLSGVEESMGMHREK